MVTRSLNRACLNHPWGVMTLLGVAAWATMVWAAPVAVTIDPDTFFDFKIVLALISALCTAVGAFVVSYLTGREGKLIEKLREDFASQEHVQALEARLTTMERRCENVLMRLPTHG